MFTGIIEETGSVLDINNQNIKIKCSKVLENSQIGDRICVSGVCLTITELDREFFVANVSAETLKVTTLGKLKSSSLVNLERAMLMNGRFGGHIVSGHTDNVAKVSDINENEEFCSLKIELTEEQAKYVVKKGSITVNGISLTIADIQGCNITIAVIPHTFKNTNLLSLKKGDFVNIEVDILAKYVEKFLSTRDNSSRISVDFLQRNGFC